MIPEFYWLWKDLQYILKMSENKLDLFNLLVQYTLSAIALRHRRCFQFYILIFEIRNEGEHNSYNPTHMPESTGPLDALAQMFGITMSAASARGLAASLGPIRMSVALAENVDETDTNASASVSVPPESSSAAAASDGPGKVVEQSLIRSVGEQLSFGGVLGFATGYTIRKVGKLLMLVVGTEVVILQYFAYREWLIMDWAKVASDMSPTISRGLFDKLLEILVYRMPFSVAFTGGLFAGLRFSAPPKN